MENVEFLPIDENCEGCNKIVTRNEVVGCQAYINPPSWFRNGQSCPLQAKGHTTTSDITQMAIKEGIFVKQGNVFVYNGRTVAGNVSGLTKLMKTNKMVFVDVNKRLGLLESQGKVRVGQQKQKKNR